MTKKPKKFKHVGWVCEYYKKLQRSTFARTRFLSQTELLWNRGGTWKEAATQGYDCVKVYTKEGK